jgi:FAD/FMN-containing dehydrogenase
MSVEQLKTAMMKESRLILEVADWKRLAQIYNRVDPDSKPTCSALCLC